MELFCKLLESLEVRIILTVLVGQNENLAILMAEKNKDDRPEKNSSGRDTRWEGRQ
jgi:hypothetical protein